jgi:hypothetical protein
MLNIIYWGGNDSNASMFFMSAPLRLAGSAKRLVRAKADRTVCHKSSNGGGSN